MAAWSHRAADAGLARRIAASLGVSEPLAAVLARSFPDEAEAERHLRPQLAHVSDPFAVGGLREAAERLVAAAAKGERIAILGDYDVDGVSSTAMLVHFLRRLGATVNAGPVFDTLTVGNVAAERVHAAAAARHLNLRVLNTYSVGLSLDETTTLDDVTTLLGLFGDALREFWAIGVLAGVAMGGSQGVSRSLQSVILPSRLVRVSSHVRAPIDGWIATCKAMGLRGGILKSANSRYRPNDDTIEWRIVERLNRRR